MGNYSVCRRVLVATIATRLELPEKWTGFWIRVELPTLRPCEQATAEHLSGSVASHTLGSPSFNPVRITCHYTGRAKYDGLQDRPYRESVLVAEYLGRVKLSRENETSSSQFDAMTRPQTRFSVVRRSQPSK